MAMRSSPTKKDLLKALKILDEISESEAKDFIRGIIYGSRETCVKFILRFEEGDAKSFLAAAKKLIDEIYKKYAERFEGENYIIYGKTEKFLDEVLSTLTQLAERAFDDGNVEAAFDIACHVILKTDDYRLDDDYGLPWEIFDACQNIWKKSLAAAPEKKQKFAAWFEANMDGKQYVGDCIKGFYHENFL